MAPAEKLTIARRLLEKVQVDRIEIASGRTSDGEGSAVRRIADWAEGLGLADRVEVLGFVDMQASVDWTRSLGGRVINLLTKGCSSTAASSSGALRSSISTTFAGPSTTACGTA